MTKISKLQIVNRERNPMSNITPKTTSRITKNKAMANENGIKKGKLNTGSPKYSDSL